MNCLGSLAASNSRLPKAKGIMLSGAVALQQGAVIGGDLGERQAGSASADGPAAKENDGPHVGKRTKCAFQITPCAVGARQIDRDAAAQRLAHQHNVASRMSLTLSQPLPRRAGIGQYAGLVRPPFAPPKAAIVEDQR